MTSGMVQQVWSFEMQLEIASRAARAGWELTRKSRVGLRLTGKARETSNDLRTRTGSLELDWDWPERLQRAGMSQRLEQEVQSWTEVDQEVRNRECRSTEYLRPENDQRVILEVTNEEGKWSDDFRRFPKLSCKTGRSLECKVVQMSGEARSLIGKWKGQTDGSPDGSGVHRC